MNNPKVQAALILTISAFFTTTAAAEEDKVPIPAKSETESKAEISCPLPQMPPAEFCLTQACAARAQQVLDKQLECHDKKMEELQVKAAIGIGK